MFPLCFLLDDFFPRFVHQIVDHLLEFESVAFGDFSFDLEFLGNFVGLLIEVVQQVLVSLSSLPVHLLDALIHLLHRTFQFGGEVVHRALHHLLLLPELIVDGLEPRLNYFLEALG